jgi:hypothetical protein
MSEHRLWNQISVPANARKALETHRSEVNNCTLYPQCGCAANLARFAERLSDEEIVWETYELAAIETVLFCSLECLSQHCPDLTVKAYALRQLSDNWWDGARRCEELSSEVVARIRAGGKR